MMNNLMNDVKSVLQSPQLIKYLIQGGIGAVSAVAVGSAAITGTYQYHDKKLQNTGVLLKILPKETTDVKETEKLIKNIHSMLLNTKFRKLRYGRPYMTFEVAAWQGKMNFFIWVPFDMKDRIIDRVYATYPEVAIEVVEDYIPKDNLPCYSSEIGLGYHHTLKIKNKSDKDILASILSAMKDLNYGEFTALQILTRPVDNKWQIKGRREIEKFEREGIRPGESGGSNKLGSILSGVVNNISYEVQEELSNQGLRGVKLGSVGGGNSSNRKSKFDRKEIVVAAEKLMEPGFDTIIRIISQSKYKKGNTARVKAISAAFNELDADNRFKKDLVLSHKGVLENFRNRRAYLNGKNNILTPSELSNFFLRLPGGELLDKFKDIERITIKQFAPPIGAIVGKKRSGVIFAKNTYRGNENLLEIKDKDLVRHIVVQGKTGSGKSEFAKTPFLDHISNIRDENGNIIRKGRGAMLLEPHGKLADEILQIIPEDRRADTIVFDLFSDHPLPFNFCKVPDRESETMTREQIVQKTVDEGIEIFKRTFSDVWSEKNEFYITNAIKAVIEADHTMVELPRMFSDKSFRNSVIPLIKDPKVKKFWTTKFKENAQGKIDSATESTASSVEYKLEKFLNSSELVRSLGQNDCIDFKDILDNDKIIIFRMSKQKMSRDRINFIGGIAIKLLIVGAFARERSKWDDPFLVFVDEAQNFINESFKDIYFELRKYGIGLVLMHQELEQLDEVPGLVNAIYNNVGTSITFTVGDLDAPFFQKKYGPRVDDKDLKGLPSRCGYCKLLVDGHTSDTFNIYSLDRPEVSEEEAAKSIEQIMEYNRKGRLHVDDIDKMIRERFNDEDEFDDEEIGFTVSLDKESDSLDNKSEEVDNAAEEKANKNVWD